MGDQENHGFLPLFVTFNSNIYILVSVEHSNDNDNDTGPDSEKIIGIPDIFGGNNLRPRTQIHSKKMKEVQEDFAAKKLWPKSKHYAG